MKNLKMICVSLVLVLSTITNANAMGERETGALIGAGAAILLLPTLLGHNEPVHYVEPPRERVIYVEPPRERVIYIDNPPPRYYYPPHYHHDYDDRYYRSYR